MPTQLQLVKAIFGLLIFTLLSCITSLGQLVVTSPGSINLECSDTYNPPYVTATSPCDGIEIDYTQTLVEGDCPNNYSYVLEVTVQDGCSNTQAVVVVVNFFDNTDPFFLSSPADFTINCDDVVPPVEFPTALDDCSEVVVSYVEQTWTFDDCVSGINRVFQATDACGNNATYVQTISIVDVENPVIVGDGTISTTVAGIFVTALDNCDDDVQITYSGEPILPSADPLHPSSLITYTATDNCGNTSQFDQTWLDCGLVSFHAIDYAGESLVGFGYSITNNAGEVIAEQISAGGPSFDFNQCLPGGCYHLHIINPDPLNPNIEWYLEGAFGGTFYGFISLEYDFSVGGACENAGCTNPSSCNYNPFAEVGSVGLCFGSCSMMTFISEGPLGNDIFGAEITSLFTNYYQTFVLPTSQILELTPFTEYTLTMSSTGNNGWNGAFLMFSNPEWSWMYQATLGPNGPFEVTFTTGGPGCTDQNACNFNPQATIDDQSCTFPQTYYLDNDNDGYALVTVQSCFTPSAGFVLTPMPLGDCVDYDPTIHPNATEICGNNVDEDCDQLVDEDCAPPAVPNDNIQNAPLAPTSGSAYPQGNCYAGTLAGTSASGPGNPANVLPGGGQDVWYSFVATSSAVRVVCTTTAMDVVLELHDVNGQVDMENATTNLSAGEIMITTGLVPGQTYFVAVRSYDGVVSNYNLCIQILVFSGCADGSGAYDLCTNFKPTYSGATSYTFNFTPTGITPGSPTSGTATSQIALSTASLALRHGGTYTVSITGNFNFIDAAGNNESVSITGNSTCSITIAPHANLRTKSTQRCPATVLKGTTLQAKPFICGALYHTISFTEVGDCAGTLIGGLPFSTTTSGSSPNKSLASIGGVQPGKWYMVQWTPHFGYGAGTPGTLDIIQVAASNEADYENPGSTAYESPEMAVYPNPNAGEIININISDITSDHIKVRVLDGTGRMILTERFTANGSLSALLVFDRKLSNGMYLIETTIDEKTMTEKIIVAN